MKTRQYQLDRILQRLKACNATEILVLEDEADPTNKIHIRANVPTIGRAYYSVFQRGLGRGKNRVGEWIVTSTSNRMPPPVDENGRPYNYSYLTPLLSGYEMVVKKKPDCYYHYIKTPDGKLHFWKLASTGRFSCLEALVHSTFTRYTGHAMDDIRALFREPNEIRRRAKLIRDFSFGEES